MSHRHADLPAGTSLRDVPTKPIAVVLLLTGLAVAAVAVVVGLVSLWPSDDPLPQDASTAYAAPGVTFEEGVVEAVGEPCTSTEESVGRECGELVVTLRTGPDADTEQVVRGMPPQVSASGVRVGDTVELQRLPTPEGDAPQYAFNNVDRGGSLALMAALFAVLVVAVARLRGFLALVGLGLGAFVLVRFMIPALLEGSDGLLVGVVGSAAIMYVVLYLAHGPSVRTSAALAGTLLGVAVTGVVGWVAIGRSRLTGISDEAGAALSSFTEIDFQGLLMCAVIVAGLGVLNDVTITQASSVWELRGAAPGLTRRQLYTRGMRIGRDHIASTIYTIVFAYAGAALSVLLLLYFFDRPLLSVLSSEEIATEVMRTLASGIGLVLAVPITTAIAALTVSGPRPVDAP
ncbi:YibE/F family protein [Nocardioides marmoraquaticus]